MSVFHITAGVEIKDLGPYFIKKYQTAGYKF